MKKSMNLYMRAITSIHAGAGQDSGIVDLPIQREATTGFPKIEASGLKGCFRELFNEDNQVKLFGKKDNSGVIAFIDARLLLFPIKSAKGIFALITCPFVIKRYIEETTEEGEIYNFFNELNNKINYITNDECYTVGDKLSINNKIVMLDEYTFSLNTIKIDLLEKCIELTPYIENLAIVSDDNYFDFVSNNTEIVTRNKIDDTTGTASDKGLFTEEYLPEESILYTKIVRFDNINKENKEDYLSIFTNNIKQKNRVQVGGNKTLGKGFMKILLSQEEI